MVVAAAAAVVIVAVRRHLVGWLTSLRGSQPLRWVRIIVFKVVASDVVVRYPGVGHNGGQWERME
jgi:hypothetical protein